ncbi:helix-turn-helix domain-containing protein [Phaeobacter sp. B1627]|uniref:helix-turn-helix domain-containing protein n=1 Tax=Phaeobacter sp. B1627 TaxID=2583809 RepID=UPI0011183786|nr:helix-turn-helix domain-containing protein [Phaeobacter sp. B1627]TNJ39061.1 helix-turn-helix domain-containing protein [Phaeobacter sp. B1627]
MKNIIRLRKEGHLTEQQVVTAHRFRSNPTAFRIAPTLFRTLFDLIVEEEALEAYEARRGWSARSAKVVLSQLLFALEELRGTHLPPDMVATTEQARAEIAYLTGDCIEEQMRAMQAFALTPMEARVFLILKNAGGKPLTEDMVMRRAYHGAPESGWPQGDITKVYVSKIRPKVKSHWRIETLRGLGYRMIAQGSGARAAG